MVLPLLCRVGGFMAVSIVTEAATSDKLLVNHDRLHSRWELAEHPKGWPEDPTMLQID